MSVDLALQMVSFVEIVSIWIGVTFPVLVARKLERNSHVKVEGSSPEEIFAIVPENNITYAEVNVYYKHCDLDMYLKTNYKKAWDLAEKNEYSKGAELFHKFVTVERKGRDFAWRQKVCDAWPYNLLQCAKLRLGKRTATVCQCLKTKLTNFSVEDDIQMIDKGVKICRVTDGNTCHSGIPALTCAQSHECVSQKCLAVNISCTMILLVLCCVTCLLKFSHYY